MTYNGVRGESQPLRDIRDLIARLDDVNKKLARGSAATPALRPADAEPAETSAS